MSHLNLEENRELRCGDLVITGSRDQKFLSKLYTQASSERQTSASPLNWASVSEI